MDNALTLRGVTKRFGSHVAVDALDLDVPRGSIYGFLGQNGAGKTTTIRMIMSILLPDAGSMQVLGSPDALSVKDRLGYLPEEKGLYRKMRAGDIVAYFGRLKGLAGPEAKKRARFLLEKYGLGASVNAKCETLSKGMGQKVQILATLIHEPELVILDEPFSGLDPVNQDVLSGMIHDLRGRGCTVIFSTHDMSQAEKLCDSVVLIARGRKVLDGPLDRVLGQDDGVIRLDAEGDLGFVAELPGVRDMRRAGASWEVRLEPGADAQEILRALVGRVPVRRFDVRRPTLHEVFVKTVGEEVAR